MIAKTQKPNFLLKGPVHQFYKLGLNEAFFHSDPENLSHSFVSCSKLLKKAKTLAFANAPIRTPKYKYPYEISAGAYEINAGAYEISAGAYEISAGAYDITAGHILGSLWGH